MTTTTLRTFAHNGYNGGQRTTDSFRIGYTAYRVWTLDGFYEDTLAEYTFRKWPLLAWMQSREAYIAEQQSRGSALRGASPQAAILDGNRAMGARRADAFHALPEVAWGEHVLIDGAEYVVTRDNNDHVRFVGVAR